MIKFEHTDTWGWEHAIRGMRNPMNSWHKSDSRYCVDLKCRDCRYFFDSTCKRMNTYDFILGNNDEKLAKSLIKAGSDHRKFLRQIAVSVDITAPLYWWKEFDQYKVGTVTNSCSTMHKIAAKEFTIEDFSHEHILDNHMLYMVVQELNTWREKYLETKDKKYWWQMIQLLPSSYNQKRTVTMNYETLLNICHARKGHKLDEWHQFREWIERLPYTKELFND